LEPVGLTNDGRTPKRPDGLTLGLWYRGLSLVLWDATVVDTFAQGHYYKGSARQAGFAATKC